MKAALPSIKLSALLFLQCVLAVDKLSFYIVSVMTFLLTTFLEQVEQSVHSMRVCMSEQ